MGFGDLKGTLVVNAVSITNPFILSGSVVVRLGDLVYVVTGEQTGNTSTAVTDNLGNTYAATQVGTATTGTVISGRAYWSRVTVAGTLTTINIADTASTNNAAAVAGVFEGPFKASPLDANPTNITTDITSPFACPTTPTLAQVDELVVCWSVLSGAITLSATAPNITSASLQQSTAAILTTTIGYQTVHATTAVTPNFTGTNPTVQILATSSFMADVPLDGWNHDQISQPIVPQGRKLATLAVAIGAASGLIAPVYTPPPVSFARSDTTVVHQKTLLYQSNFEPVPIFRGPLPFPPLAEPTRGLKRPEGQFAFVPVVDAPAAVSFAQTDTAVVHQKTLLYQSGFEPVAFTTPEVITVDKWLTAWASPATRARPPPVSVVVSVLPVPADASNQRWFAPLAEPVRQKPGLSAAAQQTLALVEAAPFPEAVTVDRWWQPFASPVLSKTRLSTASQQTTAFVPVTEVVTLDKWYARLAEPVRTRPFPVSEQPFLAFTKAAPFPETVSIDRWGQPFSLPPKARAGLAPHLQQTLAYVRVPDATGSGDVLFSSIEATVSFSKTTLYQSVFDPVPIVAAPPAPVTTQWFSPLSTPADGGFASLDLSGTFFAVEPSFAWYRPLETPVARPKLGAQLQQASAFVPVVAGPTPGSGDVLFAATQTSVQFQKTILYQSVFDPVPIVVPEVITVDKWYRPLEVPTRRVSARQALSPASSLVFTPSASVISFAATETPVVFAKSILYQSTFEPVRFTSEIITVDKWFAPLADPIRSKLGLPTAEQQSLAFVKAAPFPETVTVDRWLTPLAEPVRQKLGLSAAAQQTLAFVKAAPFETVTVDRWLLPLAEPVRQKPGLSAAQQQNLAFVKAAPFPETVSVDRWLLPLAEPVRQKLGLPAAEQQALAFVKADPFPEAVTIDRWGQPFSTPIFAKRLATAQQQSVAFVAVVAAEIITVDKWFAPFATPVRQKPGLSAAAQQTLALVKAAPFPEDVKVTSWFVSLAEPVRQKLGLSAAAQQAVAPANILPIINPAPSMATWNSGWTTPVRSLAGHTPLAAQQSTVMPIIPIPNPPPAPGVYTVSGLYVIDQFTDNTVVYDYSGGVSHRTN